MKWYEEIDDIDDPLGYRKATKKLPKKKQQQTERDKDLESVKRAVIDAAKDAKKYPALAKFVLENLSDEFRDKKAGHVTPEEYAEAMLGIIGGLDDDGKEDTVAESDDTTPSP